VSLLSRPALPLLAALALARAAAAAPACDAGNAGLKLPDGFCALEVAAGLGPVRNLAVAANGDVFAALRAPKGGAGGVLALRDGDGDGRADERRRFGAGDGHGIALSATHLYFAAQDRILRWPRSSGELVPAGEPELLVSGFPEQSEHAVKAIALGRDGALFVEVGAPSNSCQRENRAARSPGIDPCPQLERQAGIWRYRADAAGQRHAPERRFATGLRHALALAVHPQTGELWGAVNGRDMLGALWGYGDERNAALPAEELVRVAEGADFGWPYCYHDGLTGRKVLAPEYGGDGSQAGRCAEKALPALAFPAHWAPMALAFYDAAAFPARYHGGAFVAFRGSWNRAPLPQEGYRIAFVPFAEGRPTGSFETFAIAAANPTALRMTGVAQGPDGSLYLASDTSERIWRVLARSP
jgi:glucose/arabinose dehydrogenase